MRNPRVRRTLTLSLLWLFLAAVLLRFHFALLPFGLALLIAFILEPLVHALSSREIRGRRVPRIACILAIYVVVGGGLTLFGTWAVAQIGRELAGLGSVTKAMVGELQVMLAELLDRAERFALESTIPIDREEMEAMLQQNFLHAVEEFGQNASSLLTFGKDLVGGAFRVVFGSFLVLMLTAFLSMDRARIERFFASMVPPEYRGAYDTIMGGMATGLAGVVRGQVLICLTNGVLTFIGLWLLDVKLPLILACIATVFSLIPIFGSILSTLPIVALALTDGLAKGVFALLWIVGIHLVEANFLNPKIMGDSAKIHPVIVVFVLIVGESTAGLMGALFAVPIAAVVLAVFKFLHKRALEAEGAAEEEVAVVAERAEPSLPPQAPDAEPAIAGAVLEASAKVPLE